MQDTNTDIYEVDYDAMMEEENTQASFNEDIYCESNGDWLIGK